MPKYLDETGLTRFYDNIADRPVQAFDTVAEMQAATYLEDGMTCHTNSNGGAYYKVGTSGNIALQNGLYASETAIIPTMSTATKGIAKVGAGLAMNGDALELDGNGDIATAVTSWLDAHPEATTTVQDGAISTAKLEDGAVTDAKLAQTGGVLEKLAGNTFPNSVQQLEYTLNSGKVLQHPGGVVDFSDTSFKVSDPIPVTAGSLISYDMVGVYRNPLIVGYDSNGAWAATLVSSTALVEQSGTVTVPASVATVRFGCKNEPVSFGIVNGYGIIATYVTLNPLYGKKLVTAGDSYTSASFSGAKAGYDGKNYGYYVAERNGMTFVNMGIAGSIMALDKTHVDDPNNVPIDTRQPFSYQRYLNVPADTDYLTIWFGINDAAHTNLGTINDDTNETFYGAWNVVLRYFLTNHPFMKIGLIVTTGATEQYRQAVRDLAEKWGYPYLDWVNDTQVPAFFDRTGMSDEARSLRRSAFGYNDFNGHPNPEWHEYASTVYENFLRSM